MCNHLVALLPDSHVVGYPFFESADGQQFYVTGMVK